MIVYLDMDGVLVDFMSGALQLATDNDILATGLVYGGWWPRGKKTPTAALGIDSDTFWNKLNMFGPLFWASLDWCPWGKELLASLQGEDFEVVLLSSPVGGANSVCGKQLWIERELGIEFHNYIFTSRKELLASPKAFLLDDHEENVNTFQRAGGKAMLFPQPWNMVGRVPSTSDVDFFFECVAEMRLREADSKTPL